MSSARFSQLQKRALAIRDRYAELAKAQGRRPWRASDFVQGFVGDVGALAKLAMVKDGLRDGEDVDAKLAHELADCLWSVLVIAEEYGVELEPAFKHTMDGLDARIAAETSGKKPRRRNSPAGRKSPAVKRRATR